MRAKPIRSTTLTTQVASGTAAVSFSPTHVRELHKRACRRGQNAGSPAHYLQLYTTDPAIHMLGPA